MVQYVKLICAFFLCIEHCGCAEYTFKYTDYIDIDGNLNTVVKKHDVGSELGKGASGTVYKVTDKELKVTFAVKCFAVGDSEERDIEWEVRVRCGAIANVTQKLAGMQAWEAGISFTYGRGVITGNGVEQPFIALQLFEQELGNYFNENSVTFWNWARTCHEMIKSLLFAHSNGVIHGDVKPSNYMILTHTTDDGETVFKTFLTDFSSSQIDRPVRKVVNGTYVYMSVTEHPIMLQAFIEPKYEYPVMLPEADIESCMYSCIRIKFKELACFELASDLKELADSIKTGSYRTKRMDWPNDLKLLTGRVIDMKKKFVERELHKMFDNAQIPDTFTALVLKTFAMGKDESTRQILQKEWNFECEKLQKKYH